MDNYFYSLVLAVRSQQLTGIMKVISFFCEWKMVAALTILLIGLFVIIKKKSYIFPLALSTLGGEAIVFMLKDVIQRPRPPISFAFISETGFSFPSGHSFFAVSFYGLLIYFLFRVAKNIPIKVGLIVAGIILAALVGFSRIYLGVHYATDVLGGYFFGALWLTVMIIICEYKMKKVKTEKS